MKAMIVRISESVSVNLVYDGRVKKSAPHSLVWQGRLYPVTKVGLHHTYRRGRTLFHVFSVASPTLFFRLILDTETLHWKLEEISDGLAD